MESFVLRVKRDPTGGDSQCSKGGVSVGGVDSLV